MNPLAGGELSLELSWGITLTLFMVVLIPSIIIKTPDTDVFLLCLAKQHELSAHLYVATSNSRLSCLISVQSVTEKCGPAISSSYSSRAIMFTFGQIPLGKV